jgi:hypothetical protein
MRKKKDLSIINETPNKGNPFALQMQRAAGQMSQK